MNIIDYSVYTFFQSIHTPFLTYAFYTITWFFNTLPALTLFLLVSFFMQKWKSKKTLFEFWCALALSYAFVIGLKVWLGIPRPELGIITAFGSSFPSAHTALATTFFLFFLRFMRHEKDKIRRIIHVSFCILSPVAVGMSRLYLGVHWFSDVLAGFIIGVFALVLSEDIWKRFHKLKFSQE